MDSQLFLYLNLGIAAGLLFWFFFGRKTNLDKPTQLNLRNPDSNPKDSSMSRSPSMGTETSHPPSVGTHPQSSHPTHGAPASSGQITSQRPSYPSSTSDLKKQSGNHYEPKVGEETAVRHAKVLNILFLYNGHDWDAYQVLGLPAGSHLPMVTERYQQLVRETSEEGQLQFYEAAYQAILKKF